MYDSTYMKFQKLIYGKRKIRKSGCLGMRLLLILKEHVCMDFVIYCPFPLFRKEGLCPLSAESACSKKSSAVSPSWGFPSFAITKEAGIVSIWLPSLLVSTGQYQFLEGDERAKEEMGPYLFHLPAGNESQQFVASLLTRF